jgi:hypothetical protein
MCAVPVSATITTPCASHAVVLLPPAGRDENTAPLPVLPEGFVISAPPPRSTLPAGHVAVDVFVSVPGKAFGPPFV